MSESLAKPQAAADAFRKRHSLGNAPIHDMIQVVEDFCGAFVFSRSFPVGVDAYTVRDEATGATIVAVGTTDNAERQRFTIAHELGHLESGQMSVDVHALPNVNGSPAEKWADNFARHLLLPISGIDAYLANAEREKGALAEKDLSDLVRVFGVSPAVARIQMRTSGWIDQAQYDAWQNSTPAITSRALSVKHGWAAERSVLVNASQTPRRPIRIVDAATRAYQDGRTSLEALAQSAGERDLERYRIALEEAGVTPAAPEVDADDDDAEDFTDLYRSDE